MTLVDPNPPLRIGVLGCADIARRRMLPAMQADPSVTITALASRDPGKARQFAAQFGGRAVGGYRELLEQPDVDAVYVPLPPALHHDWIVAALDAGKHVLVEKPMTTDLAQARDLTALAERRRLVLMEGFMFLYHSQHAAVLHRLDRGEIGTLRGFRARFGFPAVPAGDIRNQAELGGGALLDAGVYPVRAAQLFLGLGLRVLGAARTVHAEHGVDVGGSALLVSPDGVTAQLEWGFDRSYACDYELWGSAGRLRLDRAFTTPPQLPGDLRVERGTEQESVSLPADDQFAQLAGAFARAVAVAQHRRVPDGGLDRLFGSWTGEVSQGRALLEQARLVEEIRLTAQQNTTVLRPLLVGTGAA